MKRALLCVLAAVLVAAPAAAAKLPQPGTLVGGRSLGGVALGASAADVRARLGTSFGVCDGCAETTWYYTYKKFTQPGLAVQFRGGRVDAVYTVWHPRGWRTDRGVVLGDPSAAAFSAYRGLVSQACSGYSALVLRGRRSVVVLYVFGDKLWGFAVQRPRLPVCR
jgi:hypothetical protein